MKTRILTALFTLAMAVLASCKTQSSAEVHSDANVNEQTSASATSGAASTSSLRSHWFAICDSINFAVTVDSLTTSDGTTARGVHISSNRYAPRQFSASDYLAHERDTSATVEARKAESDTSLTSTTDKQTTLVATPPTSDLVMVITGILAVAVLAAAVYLLNRYLNRKHRL